MLYADSFYDYDNILCNHDKLIVTPEEEKIRTTHNDTFAPVRNYKLNRILVIAGILPLLVMLAGAVDMLRKKHLLGLATTAGFLAALLYFSYRYPYYDMGIVKSIFIFPVFFFPLLFGVQALVKTKAGRILLLITLLCYTLPILISLWIP